jgi:hypothetical protein
MLISILLLVSYGKWRSVAMIELDNIHGIDRYSGATLYVGTP